MEISTLRIKRSEAAHRGEIAKSSFSGSGSDQTRSAIGPSWGISVGKGNASEKEFVEDSKEGLNL